MSETRGNIRPARWRHKLYDDNGCFIRRYSANSVGIQFDDVALDGTGYTPVGTVDCRPTPSIETEDFVLTAGQSETFPGFSLRSIYVQPISGQCEIDSVVVTSASMVSTERINQMENLIFGATTVDGVTGETFITVTRYV